MHVDAKSIPPGGGGKNPPSQESRFGRIFRRLAYPVTAAFFLILLARFHSTETGFSSLIALGSYNEERFIPEFKKLDLHIEDQSWGYDSQWYAQLAVRPDLADPEMATAIDNLPYRARRILFCWTAHVLGFGQPAWGVQVYALQNVVCWLILAWLLLRWFQPLDFNRFFRWWGVLFSLGVLVSVRNSLVDGPSLLLVVIGVSLVEKGRHWLAALVMGAGGLGKEVSTLAAAALLRPEARSVRAWLGTFARGLLVALPLILWTVFIVYRLGAVGTDTGLGAFAPPFVELVNKIGLTVREVVREPGHPGHLGSALMLVSVVTQFLFIVLRWDWRSAWWRVGAANAALMTVLGAAVWEGHPAATPRVLLPMLVAFNVLVPRGRRWWLVLFLGNLTLFSSPSLFDFGGRGYRVDGTRALLSAPVNGEPIKLRFDERWLPAQKTVWDYWRWSEGDSTITVSNPHTRSLAVRLQFKMSSRSPRPVILEVNGAEVWRGMIDARRQPATVPVVLPPGQAILRFVTPTPVKEAAPETGRPLGFRLFDLQVTALELRD